VSTVSDVPERWSNSSVYPDMWADPGEDPRGSDGVSPDGELATLRDYLRNYRLTLQMKCEGLNPGKLARRSVPPSTMSLLGLLRHLAEVERDWRNWIVPGEPAPRLYGAGDAAFEGAVAEQALVEGAFADLAREQVATDAVLAGYPDLGARVGRDLRRDAIGAVVVATIFMGAFIAWQFRNISWSFGAGAVIALVHDILVVVGALVIAQLQFDLTTLAALLTVIGYSVHDTIIVSDRIREDALKRRREGLPEIMNRAINETLSRTILTSGVAIVVLIALLALGGPILRPSAFTLLVGFITGTYSSIYIAGPVVLFWERRVKIRALPRAA